MIPLRFRMWRQMLVVGWHIGWLRSVLRSTLRPLKWCGFIAAGLIGIVLYAALLQVLYTDFRNDMARHIAAQMREAK